MKTLLAALLLTTVSTLAQCMDPNDPNCLGGGTNIPPAYTMATYTSELHLIIQSTPTNILLTLTNGSLYSDYRILKSDDLVTWTNATDLFEVDTNHTATFSILPDSATRYYRAKDDTLIEYAVPYTASGAYCDGPYAGLAAYSSSPFGYFIITNMSRHFAIDEQQGTNVIQYVGHYGDILCKASPCEISPYYSPDYRFVIVFKTFPGTNSYPIRLKGMGL